MLGPALEGDEIVAWPGLGQARRGHTCDFIGDTIYVAGGWIRNDLLTNTVQCFSYDSHCWCAYRLALSNASLMTADFDWRGKRDGEGEAERTEIARHRKGVQLIEARRHEQEAQEIEHE